MRPLLEEISELLAGVGGSGSFVTCRTMGADDLKLEIEDLGPIRLPVTSAAARRLCAVARPARYGLREQTRLDRRVRDTWEIPRSQITIEERRWQRALAPELDRIRRGLGLPEGCRLRAQLQSLLIYAPGQFFLSHQDSERTDDMIGTLIVSLPSQFAGGALAVEHHGEKKLFGGSARDLMLIAFYADCRHEVRPVKQGHRVVLTYNLSVEGDTAVAEIPADRIDTLSRSIGRFFETPRAPRWKGDALRSAPDRLVYLLDHEYTPRGLAWNRLKNSDAARAAALREVAERLGCESDLALADVHETWACEEEHWGDRYGRRWRDEYDDDVDDEPGSAEGQRLTDLIESDIELRHFIGRGRTPRALAAGVSTDELCWTKPSVEFEPFESEHEGYMGNYGNTVDRWYHRAAAVLWPRDRTFVIRAKASPSWAIGQIAKKLRAKAAGPQALNLARGLLPFWGEVVGRDESARTVADTLVLAAKLGDAEVAAALLRPFALTAVTAKSAPRFAELLDRYSSDWCRALLRNWTLERKGYEAPDARLTWIGTGLSPLCRALRGRSDSSEGPRLAREILKEQWAWLVEHIGHVRKYDSAKEMKKEFARVSPALLVMIESTAIESERGLHRSVLEFLAGESADDLEVLRLALLRAAHARHSADTLQTLGLNSLHAQCSQDITTRLSAPPRAVGDWSLTTPISCSCRLCGTLKSYLRASDKIRLEWPLAKEARAHVHRTIDSHDLAVRHVTRRVGRPFTLILEKTAALFERDAAERRSWQQKLEWLRETAADF